MESAGNWKRLHLGGRGQPYQSRDAADIERRRALPNTSLTTRPVAIHLNGKAPSAEPAPPAVAVLLVTWNRRGLGGAPVGAAAAQGPPREAKELVLIDHTPTHGKLGVPSQAVRPGPLVCKPTQK